MTLLIVSFYTAFHMTIKYDDCGIKLEIRLLNSITEPTKPNKYTAKRRYETMPHLIHNIYMSMQIVFHVIVKSTTYNNIKLPED